MTLYPLDSVRRWVHTDDVMNRIHGTNTPAVYRPMISAKAERWVAELFCHLPVMGRKEGSRSR